MAMRAYWDMKPDKLTRSLRELENKQGEAWDRLVQGRHGGVEAYQAHLNAAEAAAVELGIVTNLPGHPDGQEVPTVPPEPGRRIGRDGMSRRVGPVVKPIPPMHAYDSKGDFSKIPTEGWIMEPKVDGWRWQVHTTDEGITSIGGRNGKQHPGMAPAVDAWVHRWIPIATVLDGELLLADGQSRASENHRFIVFDVLVLEGKDIMAKPWSARRRELEELLAPAVPLDPVRIIPYTKVDEAEFSKWLQSGFEGCVGKREMAPYLPDTRRQDGFIKVKPQETTDAIVQGYVMGKGASNKHRVGALQVRLVETDVDTTCAWDGEEFDAVKLIGRRIELAHHGFFESGSVRHPIYKRLREDLEPAR